MRFRQNICIGLTISLILSGCKKFVEIAPPETEIVTASVFDNNSAATSAQLAIYSSMANNEESINMALNLGLLSDELTNYESNTIYSEPYMNALNAITNLGPWDHAYNYIYQANAITAALQGNSALYPTVVQQLMGEARFTRAFWLFYLTNLYGDVPLITSTDFTVNATISRSSSSLVYQQIVSDLKAAQQLLNPNYIDATDTSITTTDRSRPNKWAAAALLARAYLYEGDYVDAETESDSVINATSLYSLVANLDKVFLVNSNEAIWQLGTPLPSNYNTYDGYDFILISAPGSGANCCSLSRELLQSFEPNDARRLNWIDSFNTSTTPVATYYFPYKYEVRTSSSTTSVTEEVMVLRLAEQYLIRAEAEAEQGNTTGAISDLNVIRTRAGLPNYSGGTDQSSVLQAILHERQVELFTEWGHRWLDLIRTKSVDSVMSVITPLKGGNWNNDDYQTLFPIPQSEIQLDPNLSQNMGY